MRGKKRLLCSLPELTERELVLVWRDIRRTANIVAIGGSEREWSNYIEVEHAIERECEKRFGEKPDDYSNREGSEELPAIYKKVYSKKMRKELTQIRDLTQGAAEDVTTFGCIHKLAKDAISTPPSHDKREVCEILEELFAADADNDDREFNVVLARLKDWYKKEVDDESK